MAILFIGAELQDANGGKVDDGVFMSLQEYHQYDNHARMDGNKWVPYDKDYAVALKRWRTHKLCPWCGVCLGSNHKEGCQPGAVII